MMWTVILQIAWLQSQARMCSEGAVLLPVLFATKSILLPLSLILGYCNEMVHVCIILRCIVCTLITALLQIIAVIKLRIWEREFHLLQTETVGDSYFFTCQHGPLECQANKIHACAIAKVTQPDILLKYTTCMISDNMNPEKIGEEVRPCQW